MSAPVPPGEPPAPVTVALRGLCPRCGAPGLFAGLVRFAPVCRRCGLDFRSFDVGDGPAAILTLAVGTVIVGSAIALELAVSPPWWVHVLIWPLLASALVAGSLRLAKGALVTLEYRTAAHEARIKRS